MKRETGYYWVKIGGEWCVCSYELNAYDEYCWFYGGDRVDWDENFEATREINETRILNPDEK